MNIKKCVIFGVASTGNEAYRLLKDQFEIVGFADNDSKKWGQLFCEKVIYNPNELSSFENIEIIIASIHYDAIYKQLKRQGLHNIQVFYYMGSALDDIQDEYRMYQLSDTPLFQNCIFDENKIAEIVMDFSKNYLPAQKNEKVMLQKTDRKKVLFCAYIFPPLGGAGVQRTLKFAKYLRKFGYEPIILTVGVNDGKTVKDKSLIDDIESDITIIRIDYDTFIPEAMLKEEQQEVFNLYAGVVQSGDWLEEYRTLLQNSYNKLIPDNRMTWVNQCLKKIEQKIDLKDIDIIYTTGGPFSTYILGYYIRKKYGIKWVMDYRDPWMSNEFYIKNYYKDDITTIKLQRQLEGQLVSFCDYIVSAVDIKEELMDKYGIREDKFMQITNGYDEDDFKDIEIEKTRNEKFILCYNGTIYADRNPVCLMKIITDLIEEEKIDRDKIRWIFNGRLDKKWETTLNKEDRYGIIRYNGYLCHEESIISAIKANLLILFGGKGASTLITYTGKLFEYLRMKRPILSFSTKGGVLDKIFQQTDSGKNFDYADELGIREYILHLYDAWEQGTEILQPNEEEIRKYSRENLTLQLSKIFECVF